MSDAFDVFLSYRHEDLDWVASLARALADRGLHVWYADAQIRPGDSMADRLADALRASDYAVMVISSEDVSNWAAVELGAILALRKPLIPIIAPQVPWAKVPGPVKLRRHLPKGDPDAAADEIARVISSGRGTPGRTLH